MVVRNAYFLTAVHPQTGPAGTSEDSNHGSLLGQEGLIGHGSRLAQEPRPCEFYGPAAGLHMHGVRRH
jgi:hypothetical protein